MLKKKEIDEENKKIKDNYENSKKKPTNIGMPKDIDEDFINELTLEKVIGIIGVK